MHEITFERLGCRQADGVIFYDIINRQTRSAHQGLEGEIRMAIW